MPKPHKGEEKDAFISRAIKMMRLEGKPEKQAIAIAYSMWRDHIKGKL